MGKIIGNIFSTLVWIAEFLFFWFILAMVAPGLASAILVFVLFFGFLGGCVGLVYVTLFD